LIGAIEANNLTRADLIEGRARRPGRLGQLRVIETGASLEPC
jgi:hypothetical protein